MILNVISHTLNAVSVPLGLCLGLWLACWLLNKGEQVRKRIANEEHEKELEKRRETFWKNEGTKTLKQVSQEI